MKKLIEKINNRINNFTKETIDPFYKNCINYYNRELMKPYDKIANDFRVVYTYLLVISEIGIENSEKVRALFDNCALFFCNDVYNNNFYNDYYNGLELLYQKDKLDLLYSDSYDNEEPDVSKAIFEVQLANSLLNKKVFFPNLKDESHKKIKQNLLFRYYISEKDKPIESIIELFKMCPKKEVYLQFLEIINLADICVEIKTNGIYKLSTELFSKKAMQKNLNVRINKIIKDKCYRVNDNKLKINDYYNKIIKDIKIKNTTNNKIKSNYTDLLNFIIKSNNYIDNIDKYLNLIDDEEILEEFLKFVLKHNSVYNNNLKLENIKLEKMQGSNLEILFNKYNFNFKSLTELNKQQINQVENLEEKLKLLIKGEFKSIDTNSCIFVSLIVNFSIKQISFLEKLYKNNIIDEQFLNDNIVALSNEETFLNFEFNIELLKNIGLEKIAKYNKNIFLEKSHLISKRYKLFVDIYKIPIDNIYHFEFLENDYIFDMIDNFIELGYFKQIKHNPNYLNSKNLLMIKRLEIAKLINMTTVNSDNSFIGSIVSGNNFYISDKMLDEFLIDYKDQYIDINLLDNISRLDVSNNSLTILDKYKEDDYTYKIGDVLLSKNRILRNLAALEKFNSSDDLFNSILYKAINLSEEEISVICKIFSYKQKKLK